jgi:hypothetical protein
VIGRLRRRAAGALARRGGLGARIDALEAQVAAGQARTDAALRALHALIEERVAPVLGTLAADDPGHRRRLHELRAAPDYEAAWDEADPLVTISIPTRDRPRLLAERALASALAQTHEHLEVLVMGDAAGSATAAAVAAAGDPRARFVDLTHRWEGEGGRRHWLTATTLPRNEAYRIAAGRWLVDLDDDDALRPDAVERLLDRARAERLEVVYGVLEQHEPGGGTAPLGGFPPALGSFGWQGALVHAGLRGFAREHVAGDLGLPGDWFRMQRMLRAGVRIGHLPEVTCDYYPSTLWGSGG